MRRPNAPFRCPHQTVSFRNAFPAPCRSLLHVFLLPLFSLRVQATEKKRELLHRPCMRSYASAYVRRDTVSEVHVRERDRRPLNRRFSATPED
ncbi:hypothetical protein GGR57DRAFT_478524 [Xylariaceae sp. FL1272]|nr:hypothetical protein GGR57DRAFT_478524 [Xylariaceae sp. FL1272]